MKSRPPKRRRRRAAIAILATGVIGLAMLAASCGGDGATNVNDRAASGAASGQQAQAPALPFPPQANEPATSRGHAAEPAGTVVAIGGRPEGLAVDAGTNTLGVSMNDSGHDFRTFDALTLKAQRTVALPSAARHVSVTADHHFLVPLEGAGELAVIPATPDADPRGSGASIDPTYVKVGDHPHNALEVGRDTLVANEYGDSVSILRDGKVRATVPVDVQPGGMAAVGLRKVVAVSVRAYTVQVLDLATLGTGPSQNAGYGPSHAVGDTSDGRAMVADTRGGNVLVYATRPRLKFIGRLHLGGSPYGMAYDAPRRRLWVTDSGADKLYEIDARAGLKVVKTFPTVRQPNTVAVDPASGAAIVAGEARGQLERIAP